jgi:BirA family biotin operon repressor/biotin-[acetyl-CoA-carboxylase] ligase
VTGTPAPPARPPTLRLRSVDSTQAVALDLAGQGAVHGTTVVAEHQTAGRGRRGRRWEDEPGASLLVSILLRPRLAPARRALLSHAAAVAVAEALAGAAGVPARLRWPNDVLVGGRKVAGILLEGRDDVVAVGIGINVGQAAFPGDLATRATSLRLAGSPVLAPEALLAPVQEAVGRWSARLEAEGFEPVRHRWRALAETLGREVRVDGLAGLAVDLDQDGALLVRAGDAVHRVVAGDLDA